MYAPQITTENYEREYSPSNTDRMSPDHRGQSYCWSVVKQVLVATVAAIIARTEIKIVMA